MDAYLGMVILFCGNYQPENWAFCDGRLLPVTQYQALFSILGTMYGGDGRTNFALPDLRVTDGSGHKVNGYQVGKPSSIICVNGLYPVRS